MKKLLMTMGLLGLLGALAIPVKASAAQQWSGCMTITGVSNYIAYSGNVSVYFSANLPGVAPGGAGYSFVSGQNGVTSANIQSFLATAMAAMLSGTQVTVYFDNTTGDLIVMSLGGYTGQCI
jgi:hypothetical protein